MMRAVRCHEFAAFEQVPAKEEDNTGNHNNKTTLVVIRQLNESLTRMVQTVIYNPSVPLGRLSLVVPSRYVLMV